MVKSIRVGELDLIMRSSAATNIRYKTIFGKDIMIELAKAEDKTDLENIELIDRLSELAYVMTMQATGKDAIMMASYEGYIEWLDNFDAETFQDKDTLSEIIRLWNSSKKSSRLKNEVGPQ